MRSLMQTHVLWTFSHNFIPRFLSHLPQPFPFTLERREYGPIDDDAFLCVVSETTFGLNIERTIHEYTYVPERNTIELVGQRNDIVEHAHHFGKLVVVAPDGGEASETDDLITLAPNTFNLQLEDYTYPTYRDRNGVVKSMSHYLNKEGKDYYRHLHHLEGVPWKVKVTQEGSFSNLIFKNLHTDEVRRYIIRGSITDCFMFQNEIFCALDSHETRVIRCSTGEIVYKDNYNGFHIDCAGYVARLKDVFDQKSLVVITAVPINEE